MPNPAGTHSHVTSCPLPPPQRRGLPGLRGQVQIFRRQNEWAPEIHQAGQVRLDCLGFELPLDVIYEDVTGL